MHVQLQYSTFLPHLGGVQTYFMQAARELVRLGHTASVLCRAEAGLPGREPFGGATILRHPHAPVNGRAQVLAHLLEGRRLTEQIAPFLDGVQVAWPNLHAYAVASARTGAGIPVVYLVQEVPKRVIDLLYHPRTWTGRTRKWMQTWQETHLQRLGLERATAVVTWSAITRQDVATMYGYPAEKIHVIPPGPGRVPGNGVARDAALVARLHLPEGAPVVLCVCRLVGNKNLPHLVRAFAACRRRDAILLLVGDGPERSGLEGLAADLGVGSRLRFAGTQTDPVPFYGLGDVFVLPSLFEGFGIALLEAMACGLPCIGLKAEYPRVITATEEILEDGVTGFAVPPDDVKALAARLDALLGDGAFRRRMGGAARAACRERYSWTRHVEALLAVARVG
jgi:glycosyltransferase involved in cell wall biosynthesis